MHVVLKYPERYWQRTWYSKNRRELKGWWRIDNQGDDAKNSHAQILQRENVEKLGLDAL